MVEALRSDNAKIYLNRVMVGAVQDITINIINNTYVYEYIGGSEIRVGNGYASGTISKGLIDLKKIDILDEMVFGLTDVINFKDYLTYIFNRFEIVIDLNKIDNGEIKNVYIVLKRCVVDNISISIESNRYILFTTSFKTDNITFYNR